MHSSAHRADQAHLAELVTAAAMRVPEHPAVIDTGPAAAGLSWRQLDDVASAEADRLREHGVGAGDRVVIRLPGAACCAALIGTWRAGAIAVPVPLEASEAEVAAIVADARPAVVLGSGPESSDVPVLGPPTLAAAGRTAVPLPDGGEAIAVLAYPASGGRGAQLSHRALLANREQEAAPRPSSVLPVDRVLLLAPLLDVSGLACFLQVCRAGATLVLPPPESGSPDALAELLVAQRISCVTGLPSTYRTLLRLTAGRLREATAGTRLWSSCAPVPTRLLAEFRDATGLAVTTGYRLPEAGPVITMGGAIKPGSMGRPLPGVELRLVGGLLDEALFDEELFDEAPLDGAPADQLDEHDAADRATTDVAIGDADGTGLVAMRGANLFSGYWPDGADAPDAEGWYCTSDIGFVDPDGDLILIDRTTDLVVVSGFTVYPSEVEHVLLDLPGVRDAAVVGAADAGGPDQDAGQVVRAVLVLAPEAELRTEQVREHCASRLAPFKVPAVVDFVAELPHTPSGLLARHLLTGVPGSGERVIR